MKLLFTGGRAPATLELVRNFGRSGHEVHVTDSITPVLSAFSKYAKAFHKISSPRFAPASFVGELINIINTHKIDILFPTCEELFWIAKNKAKIVGACNVRIICDDMKKLSLLHNKYQFIEFAKAEGILSPKTFLYDGNNTFDKKYIMKPVFSRFGEDVIIAGTDVVKDYAEKQYLVQEFIQGENICSYGFADQGALKFNVCYKSPFQTTKAFTAFEPFECDEINEVAKKIVAKLNFTGNISFDFIKKGEEYYIIECNPRMTSGIHIISENDFGELFFGKLDMPLKNKSQLLIPTIATNYRLLPFRDVIFRRSDRKPFIKQLSCLMVFRSIARRNKVSLTKATVRDIEWNGDERA